ncbi:MAG: hypothetical protein PHS57_06310 [Alphaproteobacteria bacterium]|nr:hypothetical protein [Alphaproteobacteria bacterium]
MATIFMLDSASGEAKVVTSRELSKEIKRRKQEAMMVLASRPGCYVLYALKRKNGNRVEYHMMPYTLYSDRKYRAIFGEQTIYVPLSVHR